MLGVTLRRLAQREKKGALEHSPGPGRAGQGVTVVREQAERGSQVDTGLLSGLALMFTGQILVRLGLAQLSLCLNQRNRLSWTTNRFLRQFEFCSGKPDVIVRLSSSKV